MILIALGANLPSAAGPPEVTLGRALDALARAGATPKATSHFWRTPAWPEPSDPPFVNAAAVVATAFGPEELLNLLHKTETQFGRDRSIPEKRNAPRTLDLDLIDYNGRVQAGPPALPHPRMHERGFVLVPLRDIAPGWRHPVDGRTVEELIASLPPEALTMERL